MGYSNERRRPDFKGLKMLHGGDYCPEQWLHMPGVIDQDACVRLNNPLLPSHR